METEIREDKDDGKVRQPEKGRKISERDLFQNETIQWNKKYK